MSSCCCVVVVIVRRKRQMSQASPRARRSVMPGWKKFKKLFLEFFHRTRCFQDTSKSALHRHPKNLCVVCGSINEAVGFSCRATNRRNKWLEERSRAKVARELQVGSTTMRATPLENYREKQQIG